MATIKSFTDLEQSRKLAKILPIESADMREEWRDIEGYEGLYMVSNFGRVVSFQGCNPRIMKLGMTHKGYQCVGLQKEKQHKTCVVHRLVAKAFIPNPDNLPQVNHKDECKTNNRVDNLEWCTDKYNHNYGTYIERQRNFQPRNTPVLMFDLNGNFEKEFISAREAAREMNTSHALICHCCEGYGDKQNRVSLKGKLWCYKGEEDTIPSKVEFVRNYKYRTKVVVYFPDGTSKEYESATKAGKEINVCRNKLNKDGYDEKSGLRWIVS
jgi:hypothetical protein